jgi:hypothetical protein
VILIIIKYPKNLYGCETWSLTLREEHRLSVFEKRVLKRTCGPEREEVPGWWRKLHNEEFHDLYSSPSRIGMIKKRTMRMGGTCSTNGEEEEHT